VDGASGGASWSGSAGQYFALYATDSVNVTLSYQAPLFGGLLGLLLIGVGAAVTVIGAVTRGPLPPASPPSPPSDETPPPAVRP
jgi:hypothetical protein